MTEAMVRWHKSDLERRMYCVVEGNKKIAMPRYYKDKIYDEVERHTIAQYHVMDAHLRAEQERFEGIQIYGSEAEWLAARTEYHKSQFRKMYKNAEENRTKI